MGQGVGEIEEDSLFVQRRNRPRLRATVFGALCWNPCIGLVCPSELGPLRADVLGVIWRPIWSCMETHSCHIPSRHLWAQMSSGATVGSLLGWGTVACPPWTRCFQGFFNQHPSPTARMVYIEWEDSVSESPAGRRSSGSSIREIMSQCLSRQSKGLSGVKCLHFLRPLGGHGGSRRSGQCHLLLGPCGVWNWT